VLYILYFTGVLVNLIMAHLANLNAKWPDDIIPVPLMLIIALSSWIGTATIIIVNILEVVERKYRKYLSTKSKGGSR
jgi:ABC-type dipeptide/oligopeptide/nickel transport system permease subunit